MKQNDLLLLATQTLWDSYFRRICVGLSETHSTVSLFVLLGYLKITKDIVRKITALLFQTHQSLKFSISIRVSRHDGKIINKKSALCLSN